MKRYRYTPADESTHVPAGPTGRVKGWAGDVLLLSDAQRDAVLAEHPGSLVQVDARGNQVRGATPLAVKAAAVDVARLAVAPQPSVPPDPDVKAVAINVAINVDELAKKIGAAHHAKRRALAAIVAPGFADRSESSMTDRADAAIAEAIAADPARVAEALAASGI